MYLRSLMKTVFFINVTSHKGFTVFLKLEILMNAKHTTEKGVPRKDCMHALV